MTCNHCKNESAMFIRIKYMSDGTRQESCDCCGRVIVSALPDVSCPTGGYFDENLADKDHPKGQFIRSKEHKAGVLRQLGLEEAGSNRNPTTGKVTPYIADPEKRKRYCRENFGEG